MQPELKTFLGPFLTPYLTYQQVQDNSLSVNMMYNISDTT
uniref:Uncharacterized protein n=1 Tax=Anguilla anguilla TaxID=7936 RepID=A0A0E9R3H7_ANGAN